MIFDFFKNRTFGAIRSPKWSEVEKTHLQKEPLCVVCNTKGSFLNSLNVHHIEPFHLNPKLELDPTNLITLCRQHHFLFGHFLNWSSYNKTVRSDSELWNNNIKNRP